MLNEGSATPSGSKASAPMAKAGATAEERPAADDDKRDERGDGVPPEASSSAVAPFGDADSQARSSPRVQGAPTWRDSGGD